MCFRLTILCLVLSAPHCTPSSNNLAVSQNSLTASMSEAYNKTCLSQIIKNGGECELADTSASSHKLYNSNNNNEIASSLSMTATANISTVSAGQVHIDSNINVTPISNCPSLDNADSLTQSQLISRLTAPCRYDRLQRPSVLVNGTCTQDLPVSVYVRAYIYAIQIIESSQLQFKVLALLQLRYVDPRLAFQAYAPKRVQPIMGESQLRERIWIPHIFLANEHDSAVLGTSEKDMLTMIAADGTVVLSMRIQATLSCWMNLSKFPFDEQQCSAVLESWMYNSSALYMHWEDNVPIAFDTTTHLTEYVLQDAWSNETLVDANMNDLRHGAFTGNYSSLSFTIYLTRESGYYIMDYFLPSMMIVAISWVSFWLQADQTPARTTLGTSTMLSFITLASSQEKNLPKVSYVKLSEVWFLGCTFFIFGSLVEFAFVNTIWRRNRNVEVRKVSSKYILKSTLTPRKKISTTSMDSCCSKSSLPAIEPVITITDYDVQLKKFNSQTSGSSSTTTNEENVESGEVTENNGGKNTFATMTPHEVSLWIDRKARFVFPLAFIIFNALFWVFVYCL